MLDALGLYFRYLLISVRAQMQYRASFVMLSAGHFLLTSMEFLFIWVLFARFGSLRDWKLEQVALIYGMVHMAFALAESICRGFDVFPQLIKSGGFDRILLRPRSAAFQIGAQEIQLMRVGRFAQGLFVLLYAVSALELTWTVPRVGLLVAGILAGACIFGGLFIVQAAMAFWTTESLEIVNTVTYGGVESAQFPLAIYRPGFRRFFTFVIPLAAANYLPAHAIMALPDPLGSSALFQWLSPLAGPIFLACCLQVWKLGIRRYCSTGS